MGLVAVVVVARGLMILLVVSEVEAVAGSEGTWENESVGEVIDKLNLISSANSPFPVVSLSGQAPDTLRDGE